MISIQLENIENGRFSLHIEEVNYTQETIIYYLAIDPDFMPDIENTYKALLNLRKLMYSWIDCINSSLKEINTRVYLPFDFQDEYIGCLRLEFVRDGNLQVDYGYTEEIQGYSVNPSSLECWDQSTLKEYKKVSKSFGYNTEKFLIDVQQIIATINVNLSIYLN